MALHKDVWSTVHRLLEESAKGTEQGVVRILGTSISGLLLDSAQSCMMLWLKQLGADDAEPAPTDAAAAAGALQGGAEGEEEGDAASEGGKGTKRGRGSKAKAPAKGKGGAAAQKAAAGPTVVTAAEVSAQVNAHADTLEALFKAVQVSKWRRCSACCRTVSMQLVLVCFINNSMLARCCEFMVPVEMHSWLITEG